MRSLFVFLFLFIISPSFAAPSKINIKVLSASGLITDSSLPTQVQAWNMKSRIADRLYLSLQAGARTKIELNPKIVLTAFENTEFEIPTISWETREFREIKLIKGTIRLEIRDKPFTFAVLTPFFQVDPPVGTWVLNVDLDRGLADILALKGSLEVTTLNSEDKVSLKSGDKVTFRGVLEEGEISYDLLLEGRKVPKGKWLAVEKLNDLDNKKYSVAAEKKQKELFQKKNAQQNRDRLKKQAGDICVKPYGSLGECLWKKEKNECIRTRCTADGQWKDPQAVGLSFCDKAAGWSATPKKCDY